MAGEWLNGLDFQWLRNDGRGSNTFLQAFQIGAQIKQNAINSEFRKEQAQAHWRAMELRAAIESSKLKAQENIASGHAELGQVLSEIAQNKSWTDPAAKARFWGTASKYPQLMASPTFKELTQQFELADQAAWRAQLEDTKMGGRKDLEATRQQGRLELAEQRLNSLADLKMGDQAFKMEFEKFQQEHRLERDKAKASGSEATRFDMNKSDEIPYLRELDSLNTAYRMGDLTYPELQAEREKVITKYKAKARTQSPAPTKAAGPSRRVRVKAPDGTIGNIPEDQLDEAKRNGYTIAE